MTKLQSVQQRAGVNSIEPSRPNASVHVHVATFVFGEDNLLNGGAEEEVVDFEKEGRNRMMMLLPRHQRQISEAKFAAINEFMEAYGIAVWNRNELREQRSPDAVLLKEFEVLCQEMEDEIARKLAGVPAPKEPLTTSRFSVAKRCGGTAMFT